MGIKSDIREAAARITKKNICHYLVFLIFALAMAYINFRMYFPIAKDNYLRLRGVRAIVAVYLFFILLWVFLSFFIKRASEKTKRYMSFLIFTALIILQVFCSIVFRVKPTWDFGDVMKAAADIYANQPIKNIKYFEVYPHNLKPAIMIGYFMKLFGGATWSPYLLNIIAISTSIGVSYLVAKKVFGIDTALIALLFCLLTPPLYLYTPIVYTDTLALPFPILSLYFWTKWKDAHMAELKGKQLLYFFLIGLLSAIGFLIKPVAAIVFIAVIINLVVSVFTGSTYIKGIKNLLMLTAASLIGFMIVYMGFQAFINHKGYCDKISKDKCFPFTHWIMMGINKPYSEGGTSEGYGGFSGYDYNYTKSFGTVVQRKKADIVRIKHRLSQFGVGGYIEFLLKKFEWTWTDGTYYVSVKLARSPIRKGYYHQFVLPGPTNNIKYYILLCQLSHSLIVFMMFYGSIKAMLSNSVHGIRYIMVLSVLGIMLFLLIWESRSRYLVSFIPIFNILAADGMHLAINKANIFYRRLMPKKKVVSKVNETSINETPNA